MMVSAQWRIIIKQQSNLRAVKRSLWNFNKYLVCLFRIFLLRSNIPNQSQW